jgi:hypothetical protein
VPITDNRHHRWLCRIPQFNLERQRSSDAGLDTGLIL